MKTMRAWAIFDGETGKIEYNDDGGLDVWDSEDVANNVKWPHDLVVKVEISWEEPTK